jgi:hypothetical protein
MSDRTHDAAMLVGVLACGLSVAAYSSWAQFNIATAAGYPLALAWVVPVATDATAALGTRAWMSAHYSDGVRGYGRLLAIAAITLSFLTAALHLVIPTTGPIPWQVRLTIGGLPSLALAALIHLGALTVQNKPKAKTSSRKATAPRANTIIAEPAPAPESTVSHIAVDAPSPTQVNVGGSTRDRMTAYLGEHPQASGAELDAQFGTKNYGRKIRATWLKEHRGLHAVQIAAEG